MGEPEAVQALLASMSGKLGCDDSVPRRRTSETRKPSVVVTSWVDAGWPEAVIDSPVSVTAIATAIEGACHGAGVAGTVRNLAG